MKLIEETLKTDFSDSAKFYGYVLDNSEEMDPQRQRPSVLICPGGGYVMTSDREAEPIAIKFLEQGFNAFILRYSVAPAHYPTALIEAATAMTLIRKNAAAWHVDPNKLIIAGFSAGGHLAANLATDWQREFLAGSGFDPEMIKPNGLFLGYPVITAGKYAHVDSFKNLLGKGYDDPRLRDRVSLEKRVTAAMPKTFLWHTYTDDTVPMENSLLFAQALREQNIPFELHIFPNGGHGLSLGIKETAIPNGYGVEPAVSVWPELFKTWVAENI
ncbi:alpha/beta hydrolase [Lapidilactobacillus achengensis]|uniref:Alpha/beta hydrolase n=1 Tax=Lapidilactobacillus achengensis TaxID=2486000 RepID=A0ABW1UR07_9LACO|nr:alpha/beta hydrolase [Lapidilactobacillus achengensis]